MTQSNELITQLRHELQIKTDLLHAYDSAAVDDLDVENSPLEIRNVNVDLLQRKIAEMEVENRKLQETATEVSVQCPFSRFLSVECNKDCKKNAISTFFFASLLNFAGLRLKTREPNSFGFLLR